MGSTPQSFTILSWTEDLEALIAHEARVYAVCGGDHGSDGVDLQALLREFGPRFSLWNRHPPCRRPGCRSRVKFWAVRPGGSWKVNLYDVPPKYVADLHERWHATLPRAQRDKLPIVPMMRALNVLAEVTCQPCGHCFQLDETGVQAWGPKLSGAGLREIFRGQCANPACVLDVDLQAPKAFRPPATTAVPETKKGPPPL